MFRRLGERPYNEERMAKKASDTTGSNELSRLLTRERLSTARVRSVQSAGTDPDLKALLERVRSITSKRKRSTDVKQAVVRKLAHG